jgi:putative FmdB family regulatory protein
MPIFEEKCLDCQLGFEAFVIPPYSQQDVDCPRCHSRKVEQQISAPAFVISDKGHYRGRCSNPYENLTLQHVRDEKGKPVRVNSLAELRVAEKRYGFVHAFSSQNASSLDDAPQHESWAGDIRHGYDWKWTPPEQRDDRSGVDVGRVGSVRETLADHPNA